MSKLEKRLKNYPKAVITETDLTHLLAESDNARYSHVKRALQTKLLTRVRRGLYVISPELTSAVCHPFELAQLIYGPSYISLESALSYHQLIPEAVYAITSVTSQRYKTFDTPLGYYDYYHLPRHHFYLGVERVVDGDNQYFMAQPWKALCDFVYCYKKDWISVEPLIESLRIEREDLPLLDEKFANNLSCYYKSKRVDNFLRGIKRGY